MARSIAKAQGMRGKRRLSPSNGRQAQCHPVVGSADDQPTQRRREVYESRLREKLEKKEMRYRSYIDRLERRAGAGFKPDDDGM